MASSSLTPYYDNSNQETFALLTQGEKSTRYVVAGRSVSKPYAVDVIRKISSAGAKSNDHVIVRVFRVETNEDTGLPATGQVTLDISIPKDDATITVAYVKQMVGIMSSLLNDDATIGAAPTAIASLVAGGDL